MPSETTYKIIRTESCPRMALFVYTRCAEICPGTWYNQNYSEDQANADGTEEGDRLYRSDRYARILHQVERTPRAAEIIIMKKRNYGRCDLFFQN